MLDRLWELAEAGMGRVGISLFEYYVYWQARSTAHEYRRYEHVHLRHH